jgi:hypothetical protein
MSRYQGGIITKSPATPTGPTTAGRAPGIWRMDDVAYWTKQGLWPNANIPAPDASFPYVSYLMSTTATNAQQNNTFLDSSTNNLTITRNGNTTQGSINPYGANWSNYFNGTNAYLTSATSSAYAMGTGDFTIEGWFFTTASGDQALWDNRASTSSAVGIACRLITSTNTLRVILNNTALFTTSQAVTLNQWNHIAIVRASGTVTAYLNGTAMTGGSATGTTNITDTNMWIGKLQDAGYFYNGYISNFRVVKGTAVYTTTFTPPTAPITAISGTSLLTCQSNRFRDNSTNAFTITVNGNTAVTPFSPFSPAYPGYTAAASGGSGYFDGSGDYLTAPYTTANFDWYTGGVDFTIECWFFANSLTGTSYVDGGVTKSTLVGNRSATNTTDYWSFGPNTGGTVTFYYFNGSPIAVNSTATITANSWNHIAMTKTSSGITIFVNGVAQTTTAISGTPQSSASFPLTVGQGNNTSFNGYVSNLRIVRGTAIYSGNFTPPTSPLTAVTNTKLLLSTTNAGIFDAATINNMETVGNAQVSTAVSKFGTTSAAFDGTGDYLTSPSNAALNFGTGDFTWEGWIYANSLSNNPFIMHKSTGNGTGTGWFIEIGSGAVYVGPGTTGGTFATFSAASVTTNAWFHLAVTRVGTTLTCFVNGTSAGTSTAAGYGSSYDNSAVFAIGGWNPVVSGYDLNGYLDDVRITKGVARYTANFTAPTAAFPTY